MKTKDPATGTLWANARQYWPLSAASFVIILLSQGILLLHALIMRRLLVELIPSSDVQGIVWNTVLFVLIPLLAAAAQTLYQYYAAVKGREYAHELS